MQTITPSPSSPGWLRARRLLISVVVVVTLIGLFYVEEDLRGHFVWAAVQRELAARGIDLNPKSFVPAPVPDDQNFAMTPFLAPVLEFNPEPLKPGESRWRDTNGYQRAVDFARDFIKAQDSTRTHLDDPEHPALDLVALNDAFYKNAKSSVPHPATRAAAAADLLRTFEPYAPVLDEIQSAIKRPDSRFNIEYDAQNPAGILLPHLALVKRFAMVLSYRASAELALGKNAAAFADVQSMVSLSECLRSEPFMISHLVRLAILQIAERSMWEGLAMHAWSDQQLQALQSQLGKITVLADSTRPMRYEIAVHATAFIDLLRRAPTQIMDEIGLKGATIPLRLLPGGWFDLERASYARLASDIMLAGYDAQTGLINPKRLDQTNAQVDGIFSIPQSKQQPLSLVWHHRILVRFLIPVKSAYTQKSAFGETYVNEAIVACALERYRLANHQLPGTLAELTPKYLAAVPRDVITGDPLKYEPAGADQFVLYSVGWNETDDNGKNVFSGHNRDLEQGDWAWVPYSQN